MKVIKKYSIFIISTILIILTFIWNKEVGVKAIDTVKFSFKEMMLVIPPIFILMGLLDEWVPKETVVKFMGEGSGLKGIILSFLIGSAAAGPLYGAFPVATVFMKKGVKLTNVFIFIGAWSTTKIPMLLFEIASLGSKFALTRLLINIPGILIIAYTLNKLLGEKYKEEMLLRASDS